MAEGKTTGANQKSGVCYNSVAMPLDEVPGLSPDELRQTAVALCKDGARIVAFFALPRSTDGGHDLFLVLAEDAASRLRLFRTQLGSGEPLSSLSVEFPQAQRFEREIHEQHGIAIPGHPWLKPLRRHAGIPRQSGGVTPGPGYPFFQMSGAGVHEVAVGPVHAGIIEPGHFRFQCHGERVFSLEIHLGYQHRGAEALLMRSSPARQLVIAESIAGDTAMGHSLAHCMVREALAGAAPPLAADALRGIALELERLANHIGDLGAMCGDVAYLPGASYFGRLRGNFLNLLMRLSGNRFGRVLMSVGGVRFGLDHTTRDDFLGRLAKDAADFERVADMTFNTSSVLSRFEHTGVVTEDEARDLGLVGPVGRACGLTRDSRQDHPVGIFRFAHIPTAVAKTGDVTARALVRRLEAQRSITFVQDQLRKLPDGPLTTNVDRAAPKQIVVALVEGWRGEIAHVGMTDDRGQLRGYKIVDPSFHNWFGLSMALRDNEISDFPICNKSFNLSYAGHDL